MPRTIRQTSKKKATLAENIKVERKTDKTETKISDEYFCMLCGDGKSVSFQTQQELQAHLHGHGGKFVKTSEALPKQFKCDFCDEMFAKITLVITHTYKQHPDKQIGYNCMFCGTRFPLDSSRKIHINFQHKKEKAGKEILNCDICWDEFYNKRALDFHRKTFHSAARFEDLVIMPASTKITKFVNNELVRLHYCHLCGSEYVSKYNLKKHIERDHSYQMYDTTSDIILKCTKCESIFFNKKAYDVHNLHHKSTDIFIHNIEVKSKIRVDNDPDPSRIPTIWDKLDQPYKKRRVRKIEEDLEVESSQNIKRIKRKKGKNRALVDSDNENVVSDSSADEESNLDEMVDIIQTKTDEVKKKVNSKNKIKLEIEEESVNDTKETKQTVIKE